MIVGIIFVCPEIIHFFEQEIQDILLIKLEGQSLKVCQLTFEYWSGM